MWGAAPPALGAGGADSSVSHVANGGSAGQVEAAAHGWLLGPNINITAIGVQNVISVAGDNNNIAADQAGSNGGAISNSGRVISNK